MVDASKDASGQMISNQKAVNKTNTDTSRQMVNTNKNAFAAMTAAANVIPDIRRTFREAVAQNTFAAPSRSHLPPQIYPIPATVQ